MASVSPLYIALSVYIGIIDLLIVAGNSLVIFAFAFGSRRMKTFTNYFIVNLAVSDLLVGFLSVPFWIYITTLPPEDATTKLSQYVIFEYFDIMFGATSIFNLVALTVERLSAVAFPAWHFNLTWKPVAGALALSWILGAIFSALGWLQQKYMSEDHYFYFLFTMVFVLPTVIISCCYVVIFRVAQRSDALSSRRVKRDMKIARMILIIIGLFLLCWMPFFILSFMYHNCDNWCDKIPTVLIQLFKALHYTNSMMNFLVYAVRSPDYRRSFSALIRWRIPRFRSETVTSFNLARRRTLSNGNSGDNNKANGTLVGNETLNTPLPERARNGKTVDQPVSEDSFTMDSSSKINLKVNSE